MPYDPITVLTGADMRLFLYTTQQLVLVAPPRVKAEPGAARQPSKPSGLFTHDANRSRSMIQTNDAVPVMAFSQNCWTELIGLISLTKTPDDAARHA